MSASTPSGHDPVYTAVDGLVRDGTLDHGQADRVYAVMRVTPGAAAPATTSDAGQASAETVTRWPLIERLAGGLALFGAAVAVAAALVASYLSDRFDDGFEWKPFVVALGVAVALTALTAGVHLLVADRDYSRWLIAGPAGLAVAAFAFTVGIALTDWDHVSYLIGAVLLLGGAGAYVVVRSGATVAVAILGGLVLLAAFLGDVTPDDSESLLWLSIPAVLYGAAVAGAGWILPTRHVSALLGGVIALTGVLLVLAFAAFAGAFARAFAGGFGGDGGGDTGTSYSGDAATTLALGVIVCLALLGLYALTAHPGYAVLGGVGAVGVLTTGLFAVDLDHTLRWAAGVGVLGVLLAAAAGALAVSRRGHPRPRRVRPTAPPPPPPQQQQYQQPYAGDPSQTQATAQYPQYQQPPQQPYQQPQQPYQQPQQPYQQPQQPYQQPPPPQPYPQQPPPPTEQQPPPPPPPAEQQPPPPYQPPPPAPPGPQP